MGTSAYLPFLEFASKKLPGLVSFSYDWRQNNRESARQLCNFIDSLPAGHVDVIAHMMNRRPGAIHSMQHRALASLQRFLYEQDRVEARRA